MHTCLLLCKCIIKSKLRIKWFSYARAEHFSEDTMALMYRSGCRKISFGIESGSQRMLDIMNKHTAIKDSIRTLSLFILNKYGSFSALKIFCTKEYRE